MAQRTGSISHGFGVSSAAANGATEFMSTLSPPKGDLDGWDSTKPWNQQTANNIPLIFKDAMSVREEVFGEQGVPLEAEFDEDDARSWHWVAYASVGATTSSPPKGTLTRSDSGNTPADDARRASATAQRTPVGTIRLIPPPHSPSKYKEEKPVTHPDDGTPTTERIVHTDEPYIKLGRLSVVGAFRGNKIARMLLNATIKFAAEHPELIYSLPSPTTRELAALKAPNTTRQLSWQGLVFIHAQLQLVEMWEKYGFSEALRDEQGNVEIDAEPHWVEEGIEHVGMWKRIKIVEGRLY
ncbi:uncharacterized protein M421DRAFT_75022 [Didymella exigua CBS 183.55]|uniref:Uncharacterized protein n=1 Tax=Didymella exigua CBS 183.55 TaxID=1150837 RepID=A0A6A5R8I5_9PLEO|nr:uncharacterized protein M421DRAFT_75022 [Didymella exigua CBS 183.55]KAF1923530.1 hypothetical protein M421DRAFT_75022 [Didymella exigua CBS 183.55]